MKVFISSTFCDLDEERDYIVRKIFPKLRADFPDADISEVDLRWGITAEDSRNRMVTDLCLRYLHAAKPFFVGIIGDRYGSIFPQDEVYISDEVETLYPRLRQDLHERRSITEIEILNGVFRQAYGDMKAVFFIKVPDPVSPYSGEDSEQFEKLNRLKAFLRSQKKHKVIEYRELSAFDKLYDFLKEEIKTYKFFEKESILDRHAAILRQAKETLGSYRKTAPLSVKALQPAIDALDHSDAGIILESFSGMGMSTALAMLGSGKEDITTDRLFIHIYGERLDLPVHPQDFADYFMLAAKDVLEDLSAKGIEVIPKPKGLLGRLLQRKSDNRSLDDPEVLALAVSSHRWCVVLDNSDNATAMTVNPLAAIADGMTECAACLERLGVKTDIKVLFAATASTTGLPTLPKVKTMLYGSFDKAAFVTGYLSTFQKRLSPSSLDNILNAPCLQNPTLAKWICDYLREFSSFENLDAMTSRIRTIRSGEEIIRLFIDRLKEIGQTEFRYTAHMLWIHRSGISEHDIIHMSGLNTFKLNYILASMRKFLKQDSSRGLYFRNNYVAFVMMKYAPYSPDYARELAIKNTPRFFGNIKELFSAEHFLIMSNKQGWWWYSNSWMSIIPDKVPQQLSATMHKAFGIGVPQQQREMARLILISAFGGFSVENAHKAFQKFRYDRIFSITSEMTSLAAAKNKGASINEDRFSQLAKEREKMLTARNPNRRELLNYIEALLWSGDSKALAVEVGNPTVVNYVWSTACYLGAWKWLIDTCGTPLKQDDIRSNSLFINGAMAKVAVILGDRDAAAYYSSPAATKGGKTDAD